MPMKKITLVLAWTVTGIAAAQGLEEICVDCCDIDCSEQNYTVSLGEAQELGFLVSLDEGSTVCTNVVVVLPPMLDGYPLDGTALVLSRDNSVVVSTLTEIDDDASEVWACIGTDWLVSTTIEIEYVHRCGCRTIYRINQRDFFESE